MEYGDVGLVSPALGKAKGIVSFRLAWTTQSKTAQKMEASNTDQVGRCRRFSTALQRKNSKKGYTLPNLKLTTRLGIKQKHSIHRPAEQNRGSGNDSQQGRVPTGKTQSCPHKHWKCT